MVLSCFDVAKQYVTTEKGNNKGLLLDVTHYVLLWSVCMPACLCDQPSLWWIDRLIVEGQQMHLSAGWLSDCVAVTQPTASRSLPHCCWFYGSARQKNAECHWEIFSFQPVGHVTTQGPLIGCSLHICCHCFDFSALGKVVERLDDIILDEPSLITSRRFWEHIQAMSAVKTRFISDMIQNPPQTKFIVHLFLWAWIENSCEDFPKITHGLIKASTDIYFVLSETFVLLVYLLGLKFIHHPKHFKSLTRLSWWGRKLDSACYTVTINNSPRKISSLND